MLLLAVTALATPALMYSGAAAQVDKVVVDRNKNKPKPNGTGTRKPRPKPRPRPQPAPVGLTLAYRILKQNGNLAAAAETNPVTPFLDGDRLQIKVKASQEGFIYVVHSVEGQDGRLIFPDSRIRGGQNDVRANEEVIIPLLCEPRYVDTRGKCWLVIQPPAEREYYTVIYSRDLLTELYGERIEPGGIIGRELVEKLRNDRGRPFSPPAHAAIRKDMGRYTIYIANPPAANKQELIADIILNHGNIRSGY